MHPCISVHSSSSSSSSSDEQTAEVRVISCVCVSVCDISQSDVIIHIS